MPALCQVAGRAGRSSCFVVLTGWEHRTATDEHAELASVPGKEVRTEGGEDQGLRRGMWCGRQTSQ